MKKSTHLGQIICSNFSNLNCITMVQDSGSDSPLLNVPKLDYTRILAGELQNEILSAMQEFAFFYIVNIPELHAEEEVDVMRGFFDLPLGVKERCGTVKHSPSNTNVLRGLD